MRLPSNLIFNKLKLDNPFNRMILCLLSRNIKVVRCQEPPFAMTIDACFFWGGVFFFQLLYPPPTKKQQIYFSFTVTSPSQDNEQSSSIRTLGKNINKCFVMYKKSITKEKKFFELQTIPKIVFYHYKSQKPTHNGGIIYEKSFFGSLLFWKAFLWSFHIAY